MTWALIALGAISIIVVLLVLGMMRSAHEADVIRGEYPEELL